MEMGSAWCRHSLTLSLWNDISCTRSAVHYCHFVLFFFYCWCSFVTNKSSANWKQRQTWINCTYFKLMAKHFKHTLHVQFSFFFWLNDTVALKIPIYYSLATKNKKNKTSKEKYNAFDKETITQLQTKC